MEVKGPILTAFNHSKKHHLDPYRGKGEKNQNQPKNSHLSFFSLWFNERSNPSTSPKSQIMTPRNALLNMFHWLKVSSSPPTQLHFKRETDSVSVLMHKPHLLQSNPYFK